MRMCNQRLIIIRITCSQVDEFYPGTDLRYIIVQGACANVANAIGMRRGHM